MIRWQERGGVRLRQNFMMRLTSRRFFGRYRPEDVSCAGIGDWDEVKASLEEKGFRERDGLMVRKDATLATTVSCSLVLQCETEDVKREILCQRERCRALGEKGRDARGKLCYIVLMYKEGVSEADVRELKRGQTDALVFERAAGPQRIGGTMLLVLVDKAAKAGFFCRLAGSGETTYERGCRMLEELFGAIC